MQNTPIGRLLAQKRSPATKATSSPLDMFFAIAYALAGGLLLAISLSGFN